MESIEKVLIAGAGAIGLTVADGIRRYNPETLAILAAGDRLTRYRDAGIWINGERVDFAFADPGDSGALKAGPYDLIIVAVKFHQLNQVIADMKPFVGKDTIILSLLNGISSEDIIGAVYGRERLPLAMIIGADSQYNEKGAFFVQRGIINFGDAQGRDTERDKLLGEFFTRVGIPSEYHPRDMKRTLWYKFMINVGVNQTSALLRLPYGPFKRDHPAAILEAQKILESAMSEVIAIAAAENILLDDRDIERWYNTMTALNDFGYTSMCQDVLAGRKTEVELFGLTVMEYGRRHGIPTPINETLYRAIRAIELSYTL
jgi:2-dehydropantoate 2-reductase